MSIQKLQERAISEIRDINWKEQVQDSVTNIIQTINTTDIAKVNNEYNQNLQKANQFVKRVLQQTDITPEVYYFTLLYFFLYIDEEHSYLVSFKYESVLLAIPISIQIKQQNDGYILFDQVHNEQITTINGKPAIKYLQQLVSKLSNRYMIGQQALQFHANAMNYYNPFFPITHIQTETREYKQQDYNRNVGILYSYEYIQQDISNRTVLPDDIPFLYIPCQTFVMTKWDRQLLRNSTKQLIVIDMRSNTGGRADVLYNLILDILCTFCSKQLIKRVERDLTNYASSRVHSQQQLYDTYLHTPRSEFKQYIKQINQQYKPDKTITNEIYKQAKHNTHVPVIAVVINSKCYSACRNACKYLSVLPNTVFIGDDVYLKDAIGTNININEFYNKLITCKLGAYPRVNDSYQLLKSDMPGIYNSSGIKTCIDIYNRMQQLNSIIHKKLQKKPKKYLFI